MLIHLWGAVKIIDLTKSKVLLVKDVTQELGFKIIAAFPVIK